MTDETKKLFNAPWSVWNTLIVETTDGVEIALVGSATDAARIARLPELYDALKESINDKCRKCIDDTRRRGDKSYINPYDFIELGCPYNRTCVTSDYLKFLRKVRDGK